MQPHNCPREWDYNTPENVEELKRRCAGILVRLKRGEAQAPGTLEDSRVIHAEMFHDLATGECPYFAGNYRGSDHRCLTHYEVGVQGDALVGTPARMVSSDIKMFVDTTLRGWEGMVRASQLPEAQLPRHRKLVFLVAFACRVLCEFMRIHPYANGNGHMGRHMVWSTLAAFGYWPKQWPLNDRPPDPPYSVLLSTYRQGNTQPLETFVMNCIIGA